MGASAAADSASSGRTQRRCGAANATIAVPACVSSTATGTSCRRRRSQRRYGPPDHPELIDTNGASPLDLIPSYSCDRISPLWCPSCHSVTTRRRGRSALYADGLRGTSTSHQRCVCGASADWTCAVQFAEGDFAGLSLFLVALAKRHNVYAADASSAVVAISTAHRSQAVCSALADTQARADATMASKQTVPAGPAPHLQGLCDGEPLPRQCSRLLADNNNSISDRSPAIGANPYMASITA